MAAVEIAGSDVLASGQGQRLTKRDVAGRHIVPGGEPDARPGGDAARPGHDDDGDVCKDAHEALRLSSAPRKRRRRPTV